MPKPHKTKQEADDEQNQFDPDKNDEPSNRDPATPGPQRNTPQNRGSRNMLTWLMLAGLVAALVIFLTQARDGAEKILPKEFMEKARQRVFDKVIVRDDRIVGTVRTGAVGEQSGPAAPKKYFFPIHSDTKAHYLEQLEAIPDISPENDNKQSLLLPILAYWGPLILIALLIYFFVFRSIRNASGGPGGMLGSFGRSRHRVMNKEHSTVTLEDVAGIDEAKDELGEIIEFLRNPKKFQRLGGRVPRGVLLIGNPGCGKTLLAKAVAGEAEVPFFSISGSDFVEMFVGVGASRVRDLFKQAKDSSPCIIFLDEIDAVGRKRGSGMSSGGHDEREQTLNAILVEMDGFESSDQIIVIAATNRADVLDPALIRPGRFDRQINVPLPDIRGRHEILNVHARRIKMSPEVDMETLARGTPMFSGADLAAIINEAAISATMLAKDSVDQNDLEEARDKVKWGRARKSQRIEEDEKKVIAYHEAGHAVVTFLDEDSEPLHKVTIIPRGPALGVTFMLPEKDKHIHTKRQMLAMLRVTYGGRIAEDMFCGDISSGAAQDIHQATEIARAMITEYGMSDKIGFQLLGAEEGHNPWEQPEKSYSEQTARIIDEEIKALIDHTYSETKQLLTKHRDQLQQLAETLLKYETLTRDEVDMIMRGQTLSKPTVSELLKAEQDKPQPPVKPTVVESDQVVGDDPSGALPSPA